MVPEFRTLTRYSTSPTIPLVPGWYESQIYDFSVFIDPSDSTKLLMYCSGMGNPVETGEQSIGRFHSTVANPYVWVDDGQVLTKSGTGVELDGLRNGTTFYDSGTYYMYYSAFYASDTSNRENICLATSTDGLNFTKQGVVLTPSGQGRNDGEYVSEPAVLKEGNSWTMIYSYRSRDGEGILPGFRFATSTDGLTWTKGGSGDILTTVPLYGEFHQLIKLNGIYYLTYEAGSATVPYRIFMATSTTATGTYTNVPENPILSESGIVGSFDRYHVATPCVVKIGNIWQMFYCGAEDHDQPYWTNHWPGGMAEFGPLTSSSNMTSKDDNGKNPIYGVSHLDGRTPVQVKFRGRRMLVDSSTSIAFDPAVNASSTDNDIPIAKGTSSSDGILVLPWVVHATTGAVLISS